MNKKLNLDTDISALVENTIRQALQMMREGEPQYKILSYLIGVAESIAGDDSACSILVLDKEGLLRNGCSPKLPGDYLLAIDGLKPDPALGTCASAAATGTMVVTPDFKSDDKWAELRHLPLALGYAGAWSMPIKNAEGKVLGTFGTYYHDQREPSQEEVKAVRELAAMVAEVLGSSS